MTPGDALRRLEGAHGVLRPLTLTDLDRLLAYRNHPDVIRYQSWDAYTAPTALALIETMGSSAPGRPGTWFQWGIEERATGVLVGDCGLRTRDDGVQGEIGYTLAPEAQGRGLGTAAVTLMLDAAFGALGFHRVTARTDPANTRSAALLRRLGFRHEGLSIASVRIRGVWLDDDHYALLGTEWPARAR
ncbi:MAG: GNAT family protein [Candidatus Eisenbacteria bacterium]